MKRYIGSRRRKLCWAAAGLVAAGALELWRQRRASRSGGIAWSWTEDDGDIY